MSLTVQKVGTLADLPSYQYPQIMQDLLGSTQHAPQRTKNVGNVGTCAMTTTPTALAPVIPRYMHQHKTSAGPARPQQSSRSGATDSLMGGRTTSLISYILLFTTDYNVSVPGRFRYFNEKSPRVRLWLYLINGSV